MVKKLQSLSGLFSIVFAVTAHAEPQLSAQLWTGDFPYPSARESVHEDDHRYTLSVQPYDDASSYLLELEAKRQKFPSDPVGAGVEIDGAHLVSFRGLPAKKGAFGFPVGKFVSKYKGGFLNSDRSNELKSGISVQSTVMDRSFYPPSCEESETTIDTVTVKRFVVGKLIVNPYRSDSEARVLTELEISYEKSCSYLICAGEEEVRKIGYGTVKLKPGALEAPPQFKGRPGILPFYSQPQ